MPRDDSLDVMELNSDGQGVWTQHKQKKGCEVMTDFDYPTFLAARLNEQEFSTKRQLQSDPYCDRYESKYVLADIEAKRAILDRYEGMRTKPWPRESNDHTSVGEPYVLRDIIDLCRPFAGHPDYPKEGLSNEMVKG